MMYLLRFAIPIGLAFAAGLINQRVMTARTQAHRFVVASTELLPGDTITAEKLTFLEIPGDFDQQRKVFVPYEELNSIVGTVCQRHLLAAEVVQFRDVTQPDYVPDLRPDEHALPVSLSGVTIEPRFLRPGIMIDFLLNPANDLESMPDEPPSAEKEAASPDEFAVSPDAAVDGEPPRETPRFPVIGPVRLLAIGHRVEHRPGDSETAGSGNQQCLLVPLKVLPDGRYDPFSERLKDAVAAGRIRGVILRPSLPVGS